jgi:uncharacterized protein YdeI (YjbR/CyaY-like superfamily)
VTTKPAALPQLYLQTSAEWRDWLRDNHSLSNGVWLIFYKKESGKPSPDYETSIEEALCFGWVDSIIRNIDAEKYVRKFTPRRAGSKWSELNKKRIAKLIREKRMAPSGLALVKAACQTGQWDKPQRPDLSFKISDEFQTALAENPKALQYFRQLMPTCRKQYLGWINYAKQPETRMRRIHEAINLLENGRKLGLK